MALYSKQHAKKIRLLELELEHAKEHLSRREGALDAATAGGPGEVRDLDRRVLKARAEAEALQKELDKKRARHAVSPKLEAALKNPAPAQSHLWDKSRKDTHGN